MVAKRNLPQRVLPTAFILLGLVLAGVAFGADVLGLGAGSLGTRQILLLALGIALAAVGCIALTPIGQRYLAEWKAFFALPAPEPGFWSICIWFGALAGFAEAAFWFTRKFLRYRFIFMEDAFLWMVPTASVLLFAAIGAIVFVVQRRWPRLVNTWRAVFIFALLAYFCFLLLFHRLAAWASFILAAGLALQTAAVVRRFPHAFSRLTRYTLGWTAIVRRLLTPPTRSPTSLPGPTRREFLVSGAVSMGALVGGVEAWRKLPGWVGSARLPTAAPHRLNLLLVVMDTVRAKSLSVQGYGRPTTPYLERLAQSGTLFERAFSVAPWTLPSHASMFTGRWHHELSANWTSPLDSAQPTLAEAFTAAGYATAGFVANVDYCSAQYGLARGFLHYEDYVFSAGQLALCNSLTRMAANHDAWRNAVDYHELLNRKPAGRINRDLLRWLDHQKDRPFFAFLNYYDAHQPYLPPKPFDTLFGPKRSRGEFMHSPNAVGRLRRWSMTPEETQVEVDAYDGTIAYVDEELSRLAAELQRRGLWDTTLVIITSDHGEQLGEHGLFGHVNSLYLQALHVPLLLVAPTRVPAGRRITSSVSLRDLAATIVDLTGIPPRRPFPGNTLARYWSTETVTSDDPILSQLDSRGREERVEYPIIRGDMKSVIVGHYHYLRHGDGTEGLYDIAGDLEEVRDLVGDRTAAGILAQCRAAFETSYRAVA